jgi:integrase
VGRVDFDKAIWTIPAERMKAGKEHRVPLSPRAVEILKATQKLRKDWLFPAIKGGKMSGMAMTMLLRRMKVDVTVHGFRSGFRDWAAECTGYATGTRHRKPPWYVIRMPGGVRGGFCDESPYSMPVGQLGFDE